MLKYFWPILILFSQFVLAQDPSRDMDYIQTQNTLGLPFIFPVYVDLDGNISLISKTSGMNLSFGPLGQIAWNKSSSNYINPITQNEFSFSPQISKNGWTEVKRLRWEIGVGVEAALGQSVVLMGLAPYKGARQVMIRYKKSQDEKSPRAHLPEQLEEMEDWTVGDKGSFQRYGGVNIYAGIDFKAVNVVTAGFTIQNLFNVSVQKISKDQIQFSISEEHLSKRRIQTGTALANGTFNFFKANTFSADFLLNLNDPDHHELYRLALKGELSNLQQKLPIELQKLEWKGSERIGYMGLPGVAGKYFHRSEYETQEGDEEEVIDLKSSRNAGVVLPLRNHSKIVYQNDSQISLFWFSEINRANADVIERRFLLPGRIMGAKGFHSKLPTKHRIGSTLSYLGFSFSKKEFQSITPEIFETIITNFKERCETMNLDCAADRKIRKITKILRKWMNGKWEDFQDQLGFLLMEEPALIYSYVKTMNLKRSIYFKFLNQKFQSLEGMAPIEF